MSLTFYFQIERIQNPTLYSHYQLYKRSVERNMISNHPVERELFHGTDKYGIENILQSGFDRNFAGKNGKWPMGFKTVVWFFKSRVRIA